MNGQDHSTFDRMADLLDAEDTLTPAQLRADFGYLVWYSETTGCYHARREPLDGHFTEWHNSPRRFALDASSLGRLALLLLVQTALDTKLTEAT